MDNAKGRLSVDVLLPVYNEEEDLAKSVTKLRDFLLENLTDYDWRVVVGDNASTDRTLEIAKELSEQYPEVGYFHLDQKGRGRALRHAWTTSDADIMSYMDLDLSTGLEAFPPMVNALAHEGYDLGTGSRLARGAQVERSLYREFISRSYNLLIKLMFWHNFSDAQCGFKAITQRAARDLVPLVEDKNWFFDTELLLLAEHKGYRIYDAPVRWREDPGTTVKVASTAWEDIKGLWRMRWAFWLGRV